MDTRQTLDPMIMPDIDPVVFRYAALLLEVAQYISGGYLTSGSGADRRSSTLSTIIMYYLFRSLMTQPFL